MAEQSDQKLTGRARVRALLIDPLEHGGMQRAKRKAVEDHKADMDKVADRIGYLSDLGLAGLSEYLIRLAGPRLQWPPVNLILQGAWGIETPPPRESSYARSLLASAKGREAYEGGWHAELLDLAKRMGPPPNRYSLQQLKESARDNHRRVEVIRDRIERGFGCDDDRRWLDWYQATRAEAEAIIREASHARGEVAA